MQIPEGGNQEGADQMTLVGRAMKSGEAVGVLTGFHEKRESTSPIFSRDLFDVSTANAHVFVGKGLKQCEAVAGMHHDHRRVGGPDVNRLFRMGHTGRDDPDFPRRQTEFSAWTVEVRGSAGLEEQFRGSMKMGAWPALEIPTLRGNPDF
jgi:hypothetical protein